MTIINKNLEDLNNPIKYTSNSDQGLILIYN